MVFFYKNLLRKIRIAKATLFFVSLFLLQTGFSSFAQTDTEFWFVVPEITLSHQPPGGVPASFRISSGQFATTVTISMPANPYIPVTSPNGFPDIVINMAPNSFHIEDVSCWIVTPCLATFPVGAAVADHAIPRMENKPITPSGVNNFGLRITSNNPITVYYEVSRENNKEIWALKGKNGLGTEFFTPFQNQYNNWNGGATKAYSAIDIVAIEDNTSVTFTLPPGKAASYGSNFDVIPAGTTYTVNNLLKGQTFSLFPEYKVDRISQAGADRLAGVKITSTNPIAVTVKDDSFYHLGYGCYDTAGDQLVPTNIIGKEYAIIRSDLFDNDHIYMLAVEDATTIKVWNSAGTEIAANTINAQQQWYRALPAGQEFYRVTSDKPIYVWHVGGFGCEQGGALLPPIDICTGTTRVAFARTSSETFYILMIVRTEGKNGFKFSVQTAPNSGIFVDKTALLATPFTDIPNSEWSVRRYGPFSTVDVPVTNHYMENTDDIFHLGIVNGGGSSGCYYGYFSDYNEIKVDAVVAGTGSASLKACYGIPVQLHATGGTTYEWWPASSLSSSTAQSPFANPGANEEYFVAVSGACNMADTTSIVVQVSTPIEALFTADKVSGCAPLNVQFTNHSFGATFYRWDFGDGSPFSFSFAPTINHPFENFTDTIVNYTVTLLARNADFCSSIYTLTIEVLPSITASFTQTLVGGNCANPRDVQFTNTSSTYTADTYVWDFGDGFNAVHAPPPPLVLPYTFNHSFENPLSSPVTYNIELLAISPFGCTSTATNTVDVTSFFEPRFNVDKANGCADPTVGGLVVNVANISQGDIVTNSWTIVPAPIPALVFPGTNASTNITLPNSSSAPIVYTISLTVTNGEGCPKTTLPQVVTVYPEVNPAFTLPTDACNETPVNFIDATFPVTVPASNYSWTFGDGAGSSIASPSHTYYNVNTSPAGNYVANTYTVQLEVTNPWGCSNSITHSINVAPFVNADFNFIPGNICSGEQIVISNNSSGNSGDSHLWVFGDGTPDYGLANPPDKEYTNTTAAPIPRTITYTRTTRVNALSCPSVMQHDVVVYPEVNIVNVTPNSVTICDSVQVVFNTTLTQPLLNMIYTWSFGDGTPGGGASTSHIYRNTDYPTTHTYTVLLEARSEYGCWDTEPETVNVEPYIKAQVSASKVAICSGDTIDFSYLRMPSITSYSFEFIGYDNVWPGDLLANGTFFKIFENQTSAPMPVTVRLTVNNGNLACAKTFEIPITIYPEVTAAFTPILAEGCADFPVEFSNLSTGGDLYFVWEFGNQQGFPTTSINPFTHIFTNRGSIDSIYTVTLIAKNLIYGCENTTSTQIRVHPKVEANYTLRVIDLCEPMQVELTNASLNGSNFSWTFTPENAFGSLQSATTTDHTVKPEVWLPNIAIDDNITYTVAFNAQTVWNTGLPNFTCTSTAPVQTISVAPKLALNYAEPSPICSGLTGADIIFIKNPLTSTGGAATLQWDFQDGNTATSPFGNVSHTFVNLGPNDFILPTLVSATQTTTGCTATTTIPVRVHPKVESIFTFRFDSLCTPFDVEFTNSSLNGTVFNWNYGYTVEGVQQTQVTNAPTIGHTFTFNSDDLNSNTIQYPNIELTANQYHAISNLTCSHSSIKPIAVYPELAPNFSLDPTEGCNPLTVNFTNTSSGLGQYLWDFGDNTGTNIENPLPNKIYSHTDKESSKNYEVRLRATNAVGCVRDRVQTVTVYPWVVADFIAENAVGCSPLTVPVQNLSISSAYQYAWDFGYGSQTSTDEQPGSRILKNDPTVPLTIFYPNILLTTGLKPDLYPLAPLACAKTVSKQITVYPRVYPAFSGNFEGCSPLDVDFSNATNNTTNSFNGVANYLWNFGNSVTSTQISPSQRYLNTSFTEDTTYNVSLIATSVHGCDSTINHTVTVYPKPKARMELASPYLFCPGVETVIENHSEGAQPLSYLYNFGDGTPNLTTVSLDNIVHEFNNLGSDIESYTFWLTVTNTDPDPERNCVDAVSQTVYVYPRVTADFDFDPGNAACNPYTVRMDNKSSNAHNYTWDFDYNGLGSSLFAPTQRFVNSTNEDKEFYVNLHAMSDYECEHDITKTLTVYAKPVAEFIIDQPLQTYPDTTFTITNYTSPNSPAWTHSWDFGDFTYSSDQHPGDKHYYGWGPAPTFERTVSYSVTTNNNCSSSFQRVLKLLPPLPQALFGPTDSASCPPLKLWLENKSHYGNTYEWSVNGGLPFSYDFEPNFEYELAEPGYYNVKLVVKGDGGEHHYYNTYHVYQEPIADFEVKPKRVLLPEADVFLYDLSEYAISYLWNMGDDSAPYTDRNPIHRYSKIGEYRITLTVMSADSCYNTTSKFPAVWVEGYGRLRFPNAFIPSKTPNTGEYDEVDFTNDVFHPVHEGVEEYKLTVFNRWGQQIFETKNIKVGWNGYYQEKLCPQDVYVWRATGKYVNGELFDMRGNVTLLR